MEYYLFYFQRSPSSTRILFKYQCLLLVAPPCGSCNDCWDWNLQLHPVSPLATLPRQNFSARNICCLFVRLNCGSDDWRKPWTFNQSSLQSFSWMSSRCKKTYDRSPRRFSGAQRRSYTIREDSSIFFSVVTRWLRRRGQLLDDQWWQSIAEEAVRETFSQMEPNRAWSQNCSFLTCLDGLTLVCYVFSYFYTFWLYK